MLDSLLQDLRYAARTLSRSPGFTLVAVLTLALGIGANSTMFSIINAVLLRPLPYPHSERLVSAGLSGQFLGAQVTQDLFTEWQAGSQSFEQLGAYQQASSDLVGGATPEHVRGARFTADMLPLLGIRPEVGRAFLPEEESTAGPHVLLLSHGLWVRQFGGDSGVVGRHVDLDGQSATILGVLPASFDFPHHAEFWTPLPISSRMPSGVIFYLSAVGRLRPGVSLSQARTELAALSQSKIAKYATGAAGPFLRNAPVDVVSLHDRLYGSTKPTLLLLLGAVALVLLIACANVANLSLARGAGREREFAIRASLGAGRARLARQLLVESVLVSLGGGAAALLVPLWGVGAFVALSPSRAIQGRPIHVDPVVLAFTLAVALVTGLAFGLAPAVSATRTDLGDMLKTGGVQGGHNARKSRFREALVAAELAIALVLLSGAGLLTRSLFRFLSVDPGFRADHLVGLEVSPSPLRYRDQARRAFFQTLLQRVSALPGVEHAALAEAPPLQGFAESGPLSTEATPARTDGSRETFINSVTDGYFATAGIGISRGRGFTADDRAGSAPVAIVNVAFQRRFFPGLDPVGRQVRVGAEPPGSGHPGMTIVGLVSDVRQLGDNVMAQPELFRPAGQGFGSPENLVIRTRGDPESVVKEARAVVLSVDPLQPVLRAFTFEQELAISAAPRRFDAALLGLFALLALALGAIGLYGVIAYLVAQRTHEIGVRVALGAERRDVVRLVVGRGARLTLLGLAMGLPLTFGLTRVLSSFLFRVSPTDLPTFAVVTLVLALVALAASYIPARRAARVDPLVALRAE